MPVIHSSDFLNMCAYRTSTMTELPDTYAT